MERFCRACLVRYDEPMELLQYTEKTRRLFWYSTGLQTKRDDIVSFQLCKKCVVNMKAACNFKKLCRSSDKKIKSYLSLEALGVAVDFPTFLKNSDDAAAFRHPLVSGNNTPANYNKARDDDNDSTCTSIRNFMTDILQDQEVADTEARIIREVIEEEADLMDDTLDSHWLQEDNSIDSDFPLYLNFSPFATPHSVNNDHYYTPRREEQSQVKKYFTSFSPMKHRTSNDLTENIKNNNGEKELCVSIINNIKIDADNFSIVTNNNDKSLNMINTKDEVLTVNEKSIYSEQLDRLNLPTVDKVWSIGNTELRSFDSLPSIPSIENESMSNIELTKIDNDIKDQGIFTPNFYIPNDPTEYIKTCKEIEKIVDGKLNSKKMRKERPCTIDKNLARALKDENKQEYSLDDLLVSPQVTSGSSTPSITKILYGSENLIIGGKKSDKNIQEDYEAIEDIFENDKKDFDLNIKDEEFEKPVDNDAEFLVPDEIKKENRFSLYDENQFDLENFTCNICQRTFNSCKALCIHSVKVHNIKILKPVNKSYISKPRMCQLCGRVFKNLQNFHRHLKIHKREPENGTHKCDHCSVEFSSIYKLKRHKASLDPKSVNRKPGKYVCTICGATSTTRGNFRTHQRRHEKKHPYNCEQCGKGFYTKPELTVHWRVHSGEKPFPCSYCDKKFSRKGTLIKHVKIHINDKPFECDYCKEKFTIKTHLTVHIRESIKCRRKRGSLPPKGGGGIKEEMNIPEDPAVEMEVTQKLTELPYIDTEMSN